MITSMSVQNSIIISAVFLIKVSDDRVASFGRRQKVKLSSAKVCTTARVLGSLKSMRVSNDHFNESTK